MTLSFWIAMFFITIILIIVWLRNQGPGEITIKIDLLKLGFVFLAIVVFVVLYILKITTNIL